MSPGRGVGGWFAASASRRGTRTLFWIPVGLGLIALSAAVLWGLPVLLTRHPALSDAAARHKAQADVRTGVIAFLAFVGAGLGVFYNRRAVRQSRMEQITDRYSKAVDQLGSTSPEVCVGGIYALGRILRDSPEDEEAIVDVLSVFVRKVAKRTEDGSVPWEPTDTDRDEFKPSFRVQAALKVLARRDRRAPERGHRPSGVGVDPRHRIIAPDLRDSDLRGARLSDAHLRDASFRRSYLEKAHMDRADLRDARLHQADLRNARLKDADLSGAHMRQAVLTGAKLEGANLDGAQLTIGALTDEQLRSVRNADKIVWRQPSEGDELE